MAASVLYTCSACRAEVPGPGVTRGDGICLCHPCRSEFFRSPQGLQAFEVMVSLARVWAAKKRGPTLRVVPGGES